MGISSALICGFAFLVALANASHAAELPAKTIEPIIDRALQEWQVPGAAVVVVDADKILYLGGRGNREQGKPDRVTPDTVFPLASCSKAFTTTLLAMLADDGKLSWDDPVRKHVKDFHLSDPLADADVRLRDLLCHRTGVGGHDLLWYRAPWSQDEQIRRIGKLPLSQPFRTTMQYQTIMYVAAGKAAASAGGQPWEKLAHERILKPLGMKKASLTTTEALKNPDCAAAHAKKEDEIKVIPWYAIPEANPAGSLNVSARDLAAWLQLHLNEGQCGENRLVSAGNLKTTHAPQIVLPMDGMEEVHPFTRQMSYGMAWVIQDYRGELLVSHAGLIDGFRAHITLLPKRKLGLAVLANLDRTRMNLALSNQIVDLLLGAPAYDWNQQFRKLENAEAFAAKLRATQMERNRKRGTHPSLPLERFAGKYEEPAYGTATIKHDSDGLILEWSSFSGRLEHFQDNRFRILDEQLGQSLVEFHVENDKVIGLTAVGMIFVRE